MYLQILHKTCNVRQNILISRHSTKQKNDDYDPIICLGWLNIRRLKMIQETLSKFINTVSFANYVLDPK